MSEIILDQTSTITLFDLPNHPTPIVSPLDGGSKPQSWGSFHQLDFIKPHMTEDEGLVKKIALVSVPLPPGTETLGPEIMREMHRRLTGKSDAEIIPFNNEDTLLAATHVIKRDTQVATVLRTFYDTTRDVILKNDDIVDLESPQVQDYLALENIRISYIPQLAEQIEVILGNSKFLRTDPWKSVDGAILMENRHANKILTGVDAKGEDFDIDENLAVGEFGHKKWLPWFRDEGVSNSIDDVDSLDMTLLEHYDGTETVSQCGQSEGCSAFFKKVIHNISSGAVKIRDLAKEVVEEVKRTIKLMGGTKFALATLGGIDKEECSYCGKNRDENCTCSDQEQNS